MSFNIPMAKAVLQLWLRLPTTFSVIELGSQTLKCGPELPELLRTSGVEVPNPALTRVPDLYKALGACRYDSVDLDGQGTIKANLNEPLEGMRAGGYDLVTNNGTGEHIFDQRQVFETVHDLCNPRGYMLHLL